MMLGLDFWEFLLWSGTCAYIQTLVWYVIRLRASIGVDGLDGVIIKQLK